MPARALLQVLAVPAATLVPGLAVILLCPFDRTGRLLASLARCWCRALCGAAGVRVEVRGRERVREKELVGSRTRAALEPPAFPGEAAG